MDMKDLFAPGDVIYGYCNGFFGRDDYDTKTCIVVGSKYAVFKNEEEYYTIINYSNYLDKETVDKWKDKENEV